YASWGLLAGTILTTVISFVVSQMAIDVQLRKAEDYYLRDNPSALKKSFLATMTTWTNIASGVLFVVGVSLSTAFVIANFESRASEPAQAGKDRAVSEKQ